MIEVTRYVASDGKEFAKREDCIEYEYSAELYEAIKKISAHCRDTCCDKCCFVNGNFCMLSEQPPLEWEDYL